MKQHQTQCIKTKKVTDRGKRSKTLNKVKPVKNIIKESKEFSGDNFRAKEVVPLHKLQDHVYE